MRNIDFFHRLWIGHAGDGRDFPRLFKYGIRAVVQLAAEEPPIAAPRDLILQRFPLVDGSGNDIELLRLSVDAVTALLEANMPTLVCCGAGMSRSPAVIAMATARLMNIEPADALKVLANRGFMDVSPAFWNDLCAATRRS